MTWLNDSTPTSLVMLSYLVILSLLQLSATANNRNSYSGSPELADVADIGDRTNPWKTYTEYKPSTKRSSLTFLTVSSLKSFIFTSVYFVINEFIELVEFKFWKLSRSQIPLTNCTALCWSNPRAQRRTMIQRIWYWTLSFIQMIELETNLKSHFLRNSIFLFIFHILKTGSLFFCEDLGNQLSGNLEYSKCHS